MKKIHVAIIDDGVNEGFFNLELLKNVEVKENLEIINRVDYDKNTKSHGTICAGIIMKYSKDVVLSSIKILTNMEGSVDKLCTAIQWCINNQVDVINMSIGTIGYDEDIRNLKESIIKANENNIIVVAASCNEGYVSYPAVFHQVIGVKCDFNHSLKENEFIYNINTKDNVEITCNSTHSLINYNGERIISKRCNSYAAPLITSKVAEIKKENLNLELENIKESLWKSSLNYNSEIVFYEVITNLEWIKKAIIFTTNYNRYLNNNFIFNIYNIIELDNSSLIYIFEEIIQYLNLHKKDLSQGDTIILDINELPSRALLKLLEEYHNELVIINNDKSDYSVIHMLEEKNEKIYYNPLFNNEIKLEYYDEIPIVVIYDNDEKRLLGLLINLLTVFREYGYNAISFTNSIIGSCYGLEYIPLESFLGLEGCNDILNNRVNYLNGDISFIGIIEEKYNLNQEVLIEEKLDVDIYILPEKRKSYGLKNDKKVIRFTIESEVNSDFIKKIYEDILKCYNKI